MSSYRCRVLIWQSLVIDFSFIVFCLSLLLDGNCRVSLAVSWLLTVGRPFRSFGTVGILMQCVDCRFFIVSHCRQSLLLAAVCLVSDVDYRCSLSNTILVVSAQLFMHKMCFKLGMTTSH